jgi:hypothetical protein
VTQLNLGGANKESWEFSQTYDLLGSPETISYPKCSGGDCVAANTPTRSVTNTYLQGLLDTVAGSDGTSWIADISYHASGMPNEIRHGNGTKDVISVATHGMPRPSAIELKVTADNSVLWEAGTYAYDGGGNIKTLTSTVPEPDVVDQFAYDRFSRLVEARLNSIGVPNQTYGFDNYGNLTSITTAGSPQETFPVYDTDPNSPYRPINRLALPSTYDAGGRRQPDVVERQHLRLRLVQHDDQAHDAAGVVELRLHGGRRAALGGPLG